MKFSFFKKITFFLFFTSCVTHLYAEMPHARMVMLIDEDDAEKPGRPSPLGGLALGVVSQLLMHAVHEKAAPILVSSSIVHNFLTYKQQAHKQFTEKDSSLKKLLTFYKS